ncbi:MAG: tetratricopeptide repeat protein [Gemmatimonadales bacterium]
MIATPGLGGRDDSLRGIRTAVRSGKFREARAELERVPAATRDSAEGRLLGAMASWRLGEFQPSRAAALAARDGFRRRGDSDGEMRAENVAAAGAFALGDLREAESGFQRALALANLLSDQLLRARTANNLGNVAFYKAQYSSALSYYRLATTLFERVSLLSGQAESWNNTGHVWREMGKLGVARESYERAVEAAEATNDLRLLAEVLAGWAETHALLGDTRLARAQLGRARDLARSRGDRLAEVEALRVQASLERMDGDLDSAERLGTEALQIVRGLRHPWTDAEVQRELGAIYLAQDRPEEAARAFASAAEAFERIGATKRSQEMREQEAQVRAG